MRDVTGLKLEEGNFVVLKLGQEWVPATIKKIDESMLLGTIPPGHIPSVKVVVECEFNMPALQFDAQQMVIRRVPHPDHERITSKAN